MSGVDTTNQPTILDYLNEDCWEAVLEYVPIKDIIRSERVSQKWQRVVLGYLRYIRIGIMIDHPRVDVSKTLSNVYWLTLREADCSSFKMWTNKLGPSVVAAHCATEQRFNIFGANCPNLEAVTFTRLSELLLKNQYEHFKMLQRITFTEFWSVSDSCVSQYIASGALNELEIICNDKLTGQCLASIKATNFTSLFFQQCKALEFCHILAAADRLRELTKFKLIDVPNEIYNNIHVLLGKMPKLDHLHIYVLPYAFREPIKNDHYFEALCGLDSLRHLGTDLKATDEDLGNVTWRCKGLRSLLLESCEYVTGRGVATACRHAGARLAALGLAHSPHITDDDVLTCIRTCPNLTDLDVRFCSQLTEGLWARARAARRPLRARTPLTLYVNGTHLQAIRDFEEHDGLILNVSYSGLLFAC